MSPVEMSIPAGTAYVGIIRLAVASLARTAGFDEERVDDLRIAVSEACTNAVLAHEEAGSQEPIGVAWIESSERVTIEVVDRVTAPSGGADPHDSQGFSTRMVMSVALLQELADELEITSGGTGPGTTARLTFTR